MDSDAKKFMEDVQIDTEDVQSDTEDVQSDTEDVQSDTEDVQTDSEPFEDLFSSGDSFHVESPASEETDSGKKLCSF